MGEERGPDDIKKSGLPGTPCCIYIFSACNHFFKGDMFKARPKSRPVCRGVVVNPHYCLFGRQAGQTKCGEDTAVI